MKPPHAEKIKSDSDLTTYGYMLAEDAIASSLHRDALEIRWLLFIRSDGCDEAHNETAQRMVCDWDTYDEWMLTGFSENIDGSYDQHSVWSPGA